MHSVVFQSVVAHFWATCSRVFLPVSTRRVVVAFRISVTRSLAPSGDRPCSSVDVNSGWRPWAAVVVCAVARSVYYALD